MSLTPLYKVERTENEQGHFYQIEGDDAWLPGVTSPLNVLSKPALIPWAVKSCSENIQESLIQLMKDLKAKKEDVFFDRETIERICSEGKLIYKKKSQVAADLGSRVHNAIDAIIKGKKEDLEEDVKAGVQGFLDWKDSHSLKIELGDTKIASKLFRYGGSLDMVAFEGNEPIIFDFKTTKKRRDRDHGIYPEYGLQLSAYAMAFKETFGMPVKAVYALWLDKEKPGFKALKVSNINLCFESFLACLKLYNSQKFEMFDDSLIKEMGK